jgi:hypothetical protein
MTDRAREAWHLGHPELRIASGRPAADSGAAGETASRSADFADAEGHHRGVKDGVGQREPGGIASRQVHLRRDPGAADLVQPIPSIAPEKSTPTMGPADPVDRAAAPIARSAVPVQTPSTRPIRSAATHARLGDASACPGRR